MSLKALSKAIKSCDDFVKKGKTAEDRKLRKEACQPTINEAIKAVEVLTKEQRKIEKKAQKHAEKLQKERAKQQKKEEKRREKEMSKEEKRERWLQRFDSIALMNAAGKYSY